MTNITELQTLEEVAERRKEVLKEFDDYCKTPEGLHSYSYPFHQIAALDKREKELQKESESMDYKMFLFLLRSLTAKPSRNATQRERNIYRAASALLAALEEN